MAFEPEMRPMTQAEKDAHRKRFGTSGCVSNDCPLEATHFVRIVVHDNPPRPVEQCLCERHAREALNWSV